MQILGTGIDVSKGTWQADAVNEQEFGKKIFRSLGDFSRRMDTRAKKTDLATSFKGEMERKRPRDLGNPQEAGWTFLINRNQPGIQEIKKVLRRLAEHRGMADPDKPLIFNNEAEEEWGEWLEMNYISGYQTGRAPYYILIVGGPEQIPFGFQSFLNTAAAVGRVDLEPDDINAYVQKLLRLENPEEPPSVERASIFFAPDYGLKDPTFYSREYMAKPLADKVEKEHQQNVLRLFGEQATKTDFEEKLIASHPALVYVASHGAVAPFEDEETQKQVYGAIYCQNKSPGRRGRDKFFAEDIPTDIPFLKGTVFFQFSCYGYGNPANSDFELWLGTPQDNAKTDFISALPKQLLKHPNGPIAFIGHVDNAYMHAFIDDPYGDLIKGKWRHRLAPFESAVKSLLELQPVGLAMRDMYQRYNRENAQILFAYKQIIREDNPPPPEYYQKLTNRFISLSDAQNYMVYGDPGTRLRMLSS